MLGIVSAVLMGAFPLQAMPLQASAEQTIVTDALSKNGISINADHFTYYYLKDDYADLLTIPDELIGDNQIKVTGYQFPEFRIMSGNALTLDSYGNFGQAVYSFGETKSGTSIVDVVCGDVTFEVTVDVVDYADYYVQKVVDSYINEHITDNMTTYEKVEEACKFVASYDYGQSASMYGMILRGYGDCWAATDTICYFCDKLNIPAVAHHEPNSISSTHYNALVQIDGINYIAEAGYTGTAPRSYNLSKCVPYTDLSDGTICLNSFTGWDAESFEIPSEYEGKTVTKIGDEAFAYCKNLKQVTIPDTITEIGEKAFINSGLTSVEIPSSVKKIGTQAFSECYSLERVTMHSDAECGYSVFYSCESLKEFTFPNNMQKLSLGFFADCYAYRNIILPDSLTFIDSQVFRSYYTNTRNMYIPPSVTEIHEDAFYDTTDGLTIYGKARSYAETFASEHNIPFQAVDSSAEMPHITLEELAPTSGRCGKNVNWYLDTETGILTISGTGAMSNYESYSDQPWVGRRSQIKKVIVEEGITHIGDYAFMYCSKAADFELPSTLESIGENVFWNTAATSIELPKNLQSIGYFSFMCSSIERITFPSEVRLSGGVFQSGESLISAVFEKGITYIPYNTFNGATVLNHIVIPDTVTGIGEYSFCNCRNLSNIVIPSSVEFIDQNAFYKCDNLKYAVIPETVKNIGDHAFGFKSYEDETDTYTKQEDFIIYGYSGSAAENYANENGITFIALEKNKVYSLGDLTGDGLIDASDASAVLSAYAALSTGGKPELDEAALKSADVNNDDEVNAADASLILAFYSYRSTGGNIEFSDYLKQN